MSAPFMTLTDAAAKVAAFSAAVRLGLLDRIDREPADPTELARTCGATERGVRVVLAVLVEAGFVEQMSDGRYRPVLPGLAALHPLIPLWDHLPDAVRTGVPVYEAHSAAVAEVYRPSISFVPGMWGDVVRYVAAMLPKAKRVLDVGAGTAPWTTAYCERNPDCRVTALDLPAVLPATRRAVARANLADRYDYLVGDMFEVALDPAAYDLIVIAQVCNLFDATTGASLIRTMTPALARRRRPSDRRDSRRWSRLRDARTVAVPAHTQWRRTRATHVSAMARRGRLDPDNQCRRAVPVGHNRHQRPENGLRRRYTRYLMGIGKNRAIP